jgi:hypothetical protein
MEDAAPIKVKDLIFICPLIIVILKILSLSNFDFVFAYYCFELFIIGFIILNPFLLIIFTILYFEFKDISI